MKCALVIGGKVYVAWKRKMLHDVIGGYQAYIQRKIYLLRLEFGSWLRPRAASRLRARFARDKIIKSLRSELLFSYIFLYFGSLWTKKKEENRRGW